MRFRHRFAVVVASASTWLLLVTAAVAGEPPAGTPPPEAPPAGAPPPEAPPPEAPARAPGPGGYLAISGFFLGLTDTEFRDITTGGIERDIEADDGWGAGLALGYRSGRGLRLEGEATYRNNDADISGGLIPGLEINADVESVALMGNAYFEPELRFPINPYIGGGIGAANVGFDASELDIDDDDWVFAYQAMVGAVLKLGQKAGLFAGYRYFATDDPVVQGTDIEYQTHNLEVGVRIGF